MEWVDKVKDIIGGLRASGKSEKEMEDIVQQASDKETVTVAEAFKIPEKLLTAQEFEQQYRTFAEAAGETMRQLIKKINEVVIRTMHSVRQQESNNWRKMHGMPMRRKGKRRR